MTLEELADRVDAMEERIETRLGRLEGRLDSIHTELQDQVRDARYDNERAIETLRRDVERAQRY